MSSSLVVVMGVSGSGKSTVGEALARALEVPFVDGDDLHPAANVEKMSRGIPLTDEDRWPWLARVGQALAAASETGLVVACSALRRTYRATILAEAPTTRFVQLSGSRELLAARIAGRRSHFMPLALLDSQLATLEDLLPDEPGVILDAALPTDDLVRAAQTAVG